MSDWNPQSYNLNARFVSDLGAPVIELLAPKRGERILDLGCGDGVLTRKLIDFGCSVVGVDASHEMVSAARKLGIDARVNDGHDLRFHNEFDAVFSNAALHWMKMPERVAEGVWRSLKTGGRFVGEMGGKGNVERLHTALLQAVARRGIDAEAIDPWYFPGPEQYRQVLVKNNFQVNTVELIDRPTALPTGIGGWIESVAHTFFRSLASDERQEFVREIEQATRSDLYNEQEGEWHADYVRLRFLAFKL